MPTNPTCASGCAPAGLPTVSFDDCQPEINHSEVEELFIAKTSAIDFTDWTSPSEWATRLSQSATSTGNEIRRLTVIGDKPAAQPEKKVISKKRTIKLDATHTLNCEIDDTNNTNYTAMRSWQCSGNKAKIWYKTRGGKLFGGNSGITADTEFWDILARGDEHEKITAVFNWFSKFDPERCTSPI